MTAGLKEVSEKAGVSVSTVSHILSGRQERYAAKTRAAVLAAAKDLGYRSNPLSRALRTSRTTTIGAVVHEMSAPVGEIERLAMGRGYQIVVSFSRWQTEREEDEIRGLLHRRVDGLLLMAPAIDSDQHEVIEELVQRRFPLVGIGVTLARGADFVDWDRPRAYKELTEHLLGQGCRRFLFLHGKESPGVRARLKGIRDALVNVVGVQLRAISGIVGEKAPGPVEEAIASGWADAVICQTDHLALASMKTARDAGRRVSESLAITGCSDQAFSALLDIPITTIRMPYERMVQLAMARLFERIEDRNSVLDRLSVFVPAEVVIRQSSRFIGRRGS